jgi:hypothetical protein
MVSVTGTQHRHVAAAPAKQTQSGEDASVHGKSNMSVGHLAKLMVASEESDGAAHNALGQAAAQIAKMTLDARAELYRTLTEGAGDAGDSGASDPVDGSDPADTGTGTEPTDPAEGTGTTGETTDPTTGGATDPTTGDTTDPTAQAGSTGDTPAAEPEPTTGSSDPAADAPADTTTDTSTDITLTPPPAEPAVDDSAVELLEQILAAGTQQTQDV